jgi:ABC-2 type transport system permease protein
MNLLVKNELIKIVRQTSFKVMVIIFAVLVAALPLLSVALNNIVDLFPDYYNDATYLQESAEDCRQNGEMSGWIFYTARVQQYRFFEDHGISDSSAEYQLFSDLLLSAYTARAAVSLFANGTFKSVEDFLERDNWNIASYMLNVASEMDLLESGESGESGEAGASTEPVYSAHEHPQLTEELLSQISERITSYVSSVENRILSFDIRSYYNDKLSDAEAYAEAVRQSAADAENLYKAAEDDPSIAQNKKDLLRSEAESLALELEGAENSLWGIRLLKERSSPYRGWEYNTVFGIITRASTRLGETGALDRETYEANPFSESYMTDEPMTYEEYLEYVERERSDARQAIGLARYSLENNNPLPSSLEMSGKKSWQTQITSAISWSTILMIVIAGTSLASEYSSGTIRLLLIRPRKRYKILLSKFLAIGTVWLIMAAGAYAVLFLLNLLLVGRDMFVSDLLWIGGRAVAVNSLLRTFVIMLEDMLVASLHVIFAILLASLIRRAALSIALPILVMQLGSSVQYACIALHSAFGKWITWTPFPYGELTLFRTDATSDYLASGDFVSSLMAEAFPYSVVRDFSPAIGLCWAAVIAAAWITLTFVSFTKQQIKN